jgi:DNA polymerase III gamma/tau subunit
MDILAVSISALIGMGIIIIVSSSLLFLFLVSLFVKKLKKDLLNNIAELINKSNTLTETSSDSFSNIENTISFSQVKKQNINLDIKSIYTETQEILIQIKKYVDYMDSLKESLTVNPNNLAIYQNQKDSLPLIESYYNQNESHFSKSRAKPNRAISNRKCPP